MTTACFMWIDMVTWNLLLFPFLYVLYPILALWYWADAASFRARPTYDYNDFWGWNLSPIFAAMHRWALVDVYPIRFFMQLFVEFNDIGWIYTFHWILMPWLLPFGVLCVIAFPITMVVELVLAIDGYALFDGESLI